MQGKIPSSGARTMIISDVRELIYLIENITVIRFAHGHSIFTDLLTTRFKWRFAFPVPSQRSLIQTGRTLIHDVTECTFPKSIVQADWWWPFWKFHFYSRTPTHFSRISKRHGVCAMPRADDEGDFTILRFFLFFLYFFGAFSCC